MTPLRLNAMKRVGSWGGAANEVQKRVRGSSARSDHGQVGWRKGGGTR